MQLWLFVSCTTSTHKNIFKTRTNLGRGQSRESTAVNYIPKMVWKNFHNLIYTCCIIALRPILLFKIVWEKKNDDIFDAIFDFTSNEMAKAKGKKWCGSCDTESAIFLWFVGGSPFHNVKGILMNVKSKFSFASIRAWVCVCVCVAEAKPEIIVP